MLAIFPLCKITKRPPKLRRILVLLPGFLFYGQQSGKKVLFLLLKTTWKE